MMDTQALKNDIRKKIFAKRKLAHNAGHTTETVLLSSFLEEAKYFPHSFQSQST